MDIIKKTINDRKDELHNPDAILEAYDEIVNDLQSDLVAILSDGFQLKDVGDFMGRIVPNAMLIAERYTSMSDEERRLFVQDIVWVIYKSVDPNLPWIPEPFETKIEKHLIYAITDASISSTRRIGNLLGAW